MSSSNVVNFSAARIKEADISSICDAAKKSPQTGAERMLEIVRDCRHRNSSILAAFTDVAFALYRREFADPGVRQNILDAVVTAQDKVRSQFALG